MPTVLVTGANRGIGLEFCQQLAKNHDVIALCRQSSDALQALPVNVVECVDMADFAGLSALVDKLTAPFDLVINNAGVMGSDALDAIDTSTLEYCFKVNAEAPLVLTSLLFKAGLLADRAKLAFVTSRMGSIGDNDSGGRYAYRMSKAALNAACKSVALDLKPKNIPVAILHPGYVKTDMTQQQGNVETAEAVQGMLAIVEGLTLAQTGRFWHYQGHELPW